MKIYIKSQGGNSLQYDISDIAPINAMAAYAALWFEQNPTVGTTVTMGEKTYRFVSAVILENDVRIEALVGDTKNNLVLAIAGAAAYWGANIGPGTTENSYVAAAPLNSTYMIISYKIKGAIGNSSAVAVSGGGEEVYWENSATCLSLGADGTVGGKGEIRITLSPGRMYICIDNNTINDSNWRYTSLSVAF